MDGDDGTTTATSSCGARAEPRRPKNMMQSIDDERRRMSALLGLWLIASAGFALSGVFAHLPPPAVPALIFGTTLVVGIGGWRRERWREALASIDLRWLVAVHVIRAPVGAWFIQLGARGELHPRFVSVAGYGDIVAGIAAVLALVALTLWSSRARPVVWGFNVVAALDIVAVLITAQSILLFGPGMAAMRGFFAFPGPMIPTLLVPLVLLTHLLIFWRLRRDSIPGDEGVDGAAHRHQSFGHES
jgi:hypothetical protein